MLTVAFLAPGVGGMIGVCEAPLAGFCSGIAFIVVCGCDARLFCDLFKCVNFVAN